MSVDIEDLDVEKDFKRGTTLERDFKRGNTSCLVTFYLYVHLIKSYHKTFIKKVTNINLRENFTI